MNFHIRLAARSYYVSSSIQSIFSIRPAPLRTVLALLTHTAPHQYIHLKISKITFNICCNFVSTLSLLLWTFRVSLTTVVPMWCPFLQRHYPPSQVLRHHPTPWYPFAFLPLLSVVWHTCIRARDSRASRVPTCSLCPTCHALRPRGSATGSPFYAGFVLISAFWTASSSPCL
jgi:hypothetical protein